VSKCTPGPWQVVPADKAEHSWVVGDAEGGSIASCEPMGPWMSHAEASANANLIAAAPDMLAVLKLVKRFADYEDNIGIPLDAAIKKAEGAG
jgi:hypothetical protein